MAQKCLLLLLFAPAFQLFQADESSHHWALQDSEGDRKVLPRWISSVLEVNICQWTSENDKWQQTLNKRESLGRPLTRSQKERYDAWLLRQAPRFVFSTSHQKLVTDSKHLNDDCVALQLHLSEESSSLRVTAGNDEQFRLVLLRGAGSVPSGHIPEAERCSVNIYIYVFKMF